MRPVERGSKFIMGRNSSTEIDRKAEAIDAPPQRMARRTLHLGLEVAKRLKQAREASGLTIAELAIKAHTTPRTIGSLLEGKGAASALGLWADVARALKVSPAWLCFGEGEGPEEKD